MLPQAMAYFKPYSSLLSIHIEPILCVLMNYGGSKLNYHCILCFILATVFCAYYFDHHDLVVIFLSLGLQSPLNDSLSILQKKAVYLQYMFQHVLSELVLHGLNDSC